MNKEAEGKPARNKPLRPLGLPVDKLQVLNKQAGQHYVWVNESDLMLQAFEEAGYVYVQRGDPERVNSADMTGTAGGLDSHIVKVVSRNGQRQVLMRIDEGEWKRQQALRDKASEDEVNAVREGRAYQTEGMYVREARISRR